MYKTINKCTPVYLQEMFSPSGSKSVYNLGDSDGKLHPKTTHRLFETLLQYTVEWNSLPGSLRSVTSLTTFKTGLETFLINNRFDSHTAIRQNSILICACIFSKRYHDTQIKTSCSLHVLMRGQPVNNETGSDARAVLSNRQFQSSLSSFTE